MPLYDIGCSTCGHEEERFIALSEFDRPLPDHCGSPMHRIIRPTQVMSDIEPYQSMITGEMITSRRHHRDHLKDHGRIEVGNEKIEPYKPKPMTGWGEAFSQNYDKLRSEGKLP